MCIVCAGGASDPATNSAVAAAPPVWTLEQIIAHLDRDNTGWADGEVTFSFFDALGAPNRGDENYAGFQVFNAEQKAAVATIFTMLADVAGLNFVEAADNGRSDDRVTFANSDTMPDYVWGWASGYGYNPIGGGRGEIATQEVWVNTDGGIGSYAFGTYNFMALMHEILHAIGIPHPGEYNASEDEDILYSTHADYAQDSRQFTIMSYFEAEATGAQHGFNFAAAPLLHDIAVLQRIYGANMTTRTGDTVYGFNSTAGRDAFDFTKNTAPIVAIWDAGGIDTIDVSGYSTSSVIDLREGGFSSFGGLTQNLAIAYGAVVENAVGGGAADTLYGNAAANRLDGRAGADTMQGFAGNDVYVVDDRGDKVLEAKNAGYDEVLASVNFNLGGTYVERLTLTGATAVYATGNSLNNALIGNSANNVLDGGKGADNMRGEGGNDTYYVDNIKDRVYEAARGGSDTVRASVSFDMGGQYIEKLVLGGTADIDGTGNSLNNQMYGNAGANTLSGGGGYDLIEGRGGRDTLSGGALSDRFVFNSIADSSFAASDRITDLTNDDRIDLRNIDANTLVAGNQAFSLVDAFTRTAGQIVLSFDAGRNETSVLLDVNGDGAADGRILLTGDHRDFDNFMV